MTFQEPPPSMTICHHMPAQVQAQLQASMTGPRHTAQSQIMPPSSTQMT